MEWRENKITKDPDAKSWFAFWDFLLLIWWLAITNIAAITDFATFGRAATNLGAQSDGAVKYIDYISAEGKKPPQQESCIWD